MKRYLPTLRSRLTLRAVVLALVALVAMALAGALIATWTIEDRTVSAVDDYLSNLTAELEIADTPQDPNVAVSVNNAGPDRIAQIINGETGKVVLTSDERLITPIVNVNAAPQIVRAKEIENPVRPGTTTLIDTTVVTIDGVEHLVVAGIDKSAGFGFNTLTLGIAGAIVLLAAGVGLGVWLSVRSALRPVEDLTKEASQIAEAPKGTWQVESAATTQEINMLIERLNSLLKRVHESQERERAFLEDASHDLRTPITVARAELDLASATTAEDGTRSALRSAIEELDRLDHLTADLLILAKLRASPTRAIEPVRVGHVVRRTVGRMMRDPERRGVEVSVSGTGTVRGDPLTMERAVGNVLSNALRYAAENVVVDIEERAGAVFVRVCDDGPGFSDHLLANATTRFARDPGHGDGTGLGLAIAAAIAEAHGGTLSVGNQDKGGAVVTIEIPIGAQMPQPRRVLG